MKKHLLLFAFTLTQLFALAQNSLTLKVLDQDSNEPLIGASVVVEGLNIGIVTDMNGDAALSQLPEGSYVLQISYVGYEPKSIKCTLPYEGKIPFKVYLSGDENLEAVIITATRGSRSILDLPTRVEAITSEELGEKAVMNSANISMLLRESTGIMVQQTSANSGNQTLRIQGLDGRYTQLLKDGFPLYNGFSGGLSIMQVPPLDLKQVEVIKGSASTLYGGGAIAGLVNLVSKQPEEDAPELSLMLNQTSAGGSTGNIFYSQRYRKTGMTLYGAANNQSPYDPNNDNFSDIPKVRGYNLSPRFFWYPNKKTKLWVGMTAGTEERTGGDMHVLKEASSPDHNFSEENLSDRLSSQLFASHDFGDGLLMTIKSSMSYFDREINLPDYHFGGKQWASFSEASLAFKHQQFDWIFGVNLFTDQFDDQYIDSRNYQYATQSIFAQNTWTISPIISLESGFRMDRNADFGFFPLPRISALIKANENFTFRLGGGLGYKLPTIFNEESETLAFENVNAINVADIEAESSEGLNFDIQYNGQIGDNFSLSINQLFFATSLKNTLILNEEARDRFTFVNASNPVLSTGFESNVKLGYEDFTLFLQYSYTNVAVKYEQEQRQKPLTPKHNFGATLMYEVEEKWRIGYELYYIGKQYRSDYSQTEYYWLMGFMAMREFERISVFINFENFTDTRQSRFQSMFDAPETNPSNTEIWAPTDGFVANGGIMIRLFSDRD